MTLKSIAAVPVSSPVIEEDTASRSITKERSLSPLCVPRIEEQKERNSITASHYLLSSSNSILKKQIAVVNESILYPPDSPQSQGILQEDDENALHGSSEFMLVLYPEDETREKDAINMENSAEIRIRNNISKNTNKNFLQKYLKRNKNYVCILIS